MLPLPLRAKFYCADDLVLGADVVTFKPDTVYNPDTKSWEPLPRRQRGEVKVLAEEGGEGIDVARAGRGRLGRVIGQLEAHRAAAGGEFVALFGDRLLQAKAWMADLERGMALTPYRREGLLDLEHVADPKLRGGPYRVPFLEEGSRFRLASLRVVRGAEAYVVAEAGGAEGPAYTQLSVEGWLTHGAAEKALAAGAWTLKQADKKRRLYR